MASAYLSKTFSGAGNSQIWTFSAWIKRSALGASQAINSSDVGGTGRSYMYFRADNDLRIEQYNAGDEYSISPSYLFRDTNAWYHIVIAYDSTQSTSTDRIKIYVNGVRQTSFSKSVFPSQNLNSSWNSAVPHKIGLLNSIYFDGYMAHVHSVDGTAHDADTFGETDSTTGIWKPKTSPSVTYGTNGFFLDMADSSAMGNDVSGNNNDFTVSGTLTQTIDTPSNVFATLNALSVPTSNKPTFSNGNTTSITSSASGTYQHGGTTTLGVTKGKYYIEAKATVDTTYSRNIILVTGEASTFARTNSTSLTNSTVTYASEGGEVRKNGTLSYTGNTYATGDIVSVALDLDNNYVYFGKNGTWENSGDPTSGSSGTGGVSLISVDSSTDGAYFFGQGDNTGTTSPSKFEFNFGNGYFGTTAVSSAGTNAGIGTFEYDVPSGYKALCTKNINAEEYD